MPSDRVSTCAEFAEQLKPYVGDSPPLKATNVHIWKYGNGIYWGLAGWAFVIDCKVSKELYAEVQRRYPVADTLYNLRELYRRLSS